VKVTRHETLDGTIFYQQVDQRDSGGRLFKDREDGPVIIHPNGVEIWMKNGDYHREDGPAIIYADGAEGWILDGKLHREDGPAVVAPDGLGNYYLHGRMYSYEGWLEALGRTP